MERYLWGSCGHIYCGNGRARKHGATSCSTRCWPSASYVVFRKCNGCLARATPQHFAAEPESMDLPVFAWEDIPWTELALESLAGR